MFCTGNCFHRNADSESRHLLDDQRCSSDVAELQPYNTPVEEYNQKEQENQQPKQDDSLCSSSRLAGYVLLAFLILDRTAGTLTSQLAAGSTNVFLLNALRYALQALLSVIMALVTNTSLLIQRRYIVYLFGWIATNFICASCVFFTASFFPVGNMDALYIIMYIFTTSVIDMVKKHSELHNLLTSSLAVIGVVLLVQPWNVEGEKSMIHMVPCEYWSINRAVGNSSTLQVNNTSLSEYQHQSRLNTSLPDLDSFHFIIIDGVKHSIPMNPLFLGYILLAVACSMGVTLSYIAKYSKDKITAPPFLFWSGIVEGLCSFLVNAIWASSNHISVFAFPSEGLCLVFALLFVFVLGIINILFVSSVRYFNVSTVAVTYVCMILILYISQRTWLKAFHPGHANYLEAIGIVVILCAFLVNPLKELLHRVFCSPHSD